MLTTVANFYQELYTEKLVDPEAMQLCLQSLTWALEEDEQQQLEEDWMLEELKKTLHSFKNGKIPGSDGLPKEFYLIFWDLVGLDLLELFQEHLQEGHLGAGMEWGLMTLLYKKGPRQELN
ncbi:hypothetical protein Y1Q_0016151 [Alligator mississippiensis]|uniref:Reverse transcriptase domain-containing protein n=1 Tax=Alligator mississippiensis TaxID=8496 RepID=A0A151P232_ALLMI|nr:hypothetical protein Y1Q_0016151 [Alligator mississippiensis]